MAVVHGEFEWGSDKNDLYIKKHRLSFSQEKVDLERPTLEEQRLVGIGSVGGIVVVTTVFTERERTRIISSCLATKAEEAFYDEQRDLYR